MKPGGCTGAGGGWAGGAGVRGVREAGACEGYRSLARRGQRAVAGVCGACLRQPPLLPGQPVSGTRRRCQGKLAAPLPSNKPGPTRREDPPGPARRCPPRAQCQAGRAGPAPGDGERAHWSLPRPPACPDLGEPWARGRGGGGEPGPRELPGAQPANLRPARVRSGLAAVLPPAPRTVGRGWALGMGGKQGLHTAPLPGKVRWGGWALGKRGPSVPLPGGLGLLTPMKTGAG